MEKALLPSLLPVSVSSQSRPQIWTFTFYLLW